jgi:hypothetical protein
VLVLDAALGLPPETPDGDWRVQSAAWAQALRAGYQRHPWVLELPISALPAGPNQLVWFDRGLAALAGTRLEEGEKASSVLLISSYVRTQAMLWQDLLKATEAGRRTGGGGRAWPTCPVPAVARAVAGILPTTGQPGPPS